MKRQAETIRISILLPVALALLILLVVTILFTFVIERGHMDEDIGETLASVESLFEAEIHNRVTIMSSLIEELMGRKHLEESFVKQDRESLLSDAEPFYNRIHDRYHVTHLYFLEPDRRCFLRVHMPQRHGDIIQRATAVRASKTGQGTHGMELGPLGTFVLRVVFPWEVRGKRIGFIELSEDLEDIAETVRPVFQVEFLVLISKRFIQQKDWELGLQVLGRSGGRWDALPDHAIMMTTLGNTPPALGEALRRYEEDPKGRLMGVKAGDQNLRGGMIPLTDAEDRRIGEIVMLVDVTPRLASLRAMSMKLALVGVPFAGLLFAFLYLYTGRIQKNIVRDANNLREEIRERKIAEREARRSREFLEQSIESVTHPFLVIDAEDYTIIKANAAARRYSDREAKHCYALSHNSEEPCQGPDHLCPLREVRRTGHPAIVEHIHYLSDGTPRVVEIHAYPVRGSDGRIGQIIEYVVDITDRKKMQESIEASLQEKELLLREIHHRVRNNMQAIYGLLELQRGYVEEPEIVDVLKECQNRILSMSMVHEQLYQQPDLAHIRMKTYLNDLAHKVVTSFRGRGDTLQLETDIQDTTFSVEKAMPCGILVNELLSNALKHAFPKGMQDKGKIRISLRREDDGFFELMVSDNGIGFPDDLTINAAETFGMQMLKAFGEEELGGTLALERSEGTTFRIRFKLEQTNAHAA